MKRIVLSLLTVCFGAFGLAGPFQVGLQTAKAADTEKSIILDIAIDCRTFRNNLGLPFANFGRGDGFIANGKLFPRGTLLPGAQSNDPDSAGSIGKYIEHGTFLHPSTLTSLSIGHSQIVLAPLKISSLENERTESRLGRFSLDIPGGITTRRISDGGVG